MNRQRRGYNKSEMDIKRVLYIAGGILSLSVRNAGIPYGTLLDRRARLWKLSGKCSCQLYRPGSTVYKNHWT